MFVTQGALVGLMGGLSGAAPGYLALLPFSGVEDGRSAAPAIRQTGAKDERHGEDGECDRIGRRRRLIRRHDGDWLRFGRMSPCKAQ
ncbi:hypothetical protein [Roseibium aquae]|uniref:hypothetical protein n=1 Tax=Roseibium aquae TaxID=1323746 RepID=UPI00123D77DA|nr:hypothetical protein [Roseibium aquae]